MPVIVLKYGGSSIADIEKIKKVAAAIASVKESGYAVAVVVSAMGKTTDSLIETAKMISNDPPKREIDMLLSTGERITMSLLCIALNNLGIDSVSLTGSQAGIITNDRHNDARVIEVRPFRVIDELDNGKVVVIGGFQGVSYKRDITTLGRGGSDTTAIALAAALEAERCEIYSDVDGVYTADPSMIKEAKHLPELSYEQMQEMSEAGAKVLNSQAVQFAKNANIAIYARSTFSQGKETIIRKLPAGIHKGVSSIVYESDVARVSFCTEKLKNDLDLLFDYLDGKQIKIKELNYFEEENSIKASFIISYQNIHNLSLIQKELNDKFKNNINFYLNFGTVSVIGEGINNDNTILTETIKLLKNNEIDVKGISTTSFRISLLMDRQKIKEAVKICHKRWIEQS